MTTYEPSIRDRVRIALAFTILETKEPDTDLETCTMRFRDRFPRPRTHHHQKSQNRKSKDDERYEDANETEASRARWQSKIKTMQEEIDSLTKQLAERDADISVLHTDLEATQAIGKPPPKKKQKKTPLGPATLGAGAAAGPSQPTNANPDSGERDVPDTGIGENATKKKVGKSGTNKASGQEGQEAVLQTLARKLDEVLEQATNETNSMHRTAGLLIKLFDAPTDLSHEFLPLRLQAIFLHAQDLIETCSTYLEASLEATLYPSLAEVKRSISFRVQHPGRVLQIITMLLHNVLPALSSAIGGILNEIDDLPGFDHAEVETRWNELILLIGKKLVGPSVEGIRKTSDKVFAEQQRLERERASRTRFMQSSMAQTETNRRDIRENLVKLLLTLTQCQMSLKMKEESGSERGINAHALAEMVAFKTTTELVDILKPEPNGRHAPRPFEGRGHARQELSPDHETVRILLLVLRSSIPCLPSYISDNISHGKQHSRYLVDAFVKRGPEGSPTSRQDGLFPPMNLLLGMTIRSQLVQLLSPIVHPITSALYDCFSAFKSDAPQVSGLLDDRTLRDALMQVAEELMLAEGDEQAGISEWVTDQIDVGHMKINDKEEEAEIAPATEPKEPTMTMDVAQETVAKGDAPCPPTSPAEETSEIVIRNPVEPIIADMIPEAPSEEPETLFSFSMPFGPLEQTLPVNQQSQGSPEEPIQYPLVDVLSTSPALIALPASPDVSIDELIPASSHGVGLTTFHALPITDLSNVTPTSVDQHATRITTIALTQNEQPMMPLHQDGTFTTLTKSMSQPDPSAHDDLTAPLPVGKRPESQ